METQDPRPLNRTELFRNLGSAGPKQISTQLFKSVPKKIKDPRLRAVFMHKHGNYHEHGRILKFLRNVVAHVNDAAQNFNMPKIRLEIEIHSLALKQVDAAIFHINYLSDGLLRYALTGVFKFMDNVRISMTQKLLFVEGVEYRRGFKGFDTNPYV